MQMPVLYILLFIHLLFIHLLFIHLLFIHLLFIHPCSFLIEASTAPVGEYFNRGHLVLRTRLSIAVGIWNGLAVFPSSDEDLLFGRTGRSAATHSVCRRDCEKNALFLRRVGFAQARCWSGILCIQTFCHGILQAGIVDHIDM
jgi:hypothetical protein